MITMEWKSEREKARKKSKFQPEPIEVNLIVVENRMKMTSRSEEKKIRWRQYYASFAKFNDIFNEPISFLSALCFVSFTVDFIDGKYYQMIYCMFIDS